MNQNNKKQIPSLETYLQSLDLPVYLLNPQTPIEATSDWYREAKEKYYKTYGQETIESTRFRKEGE